MNPMPRAMSATTLLALLGWSACENATDDLLADKACTPAGLCATGYRCNDAGLCTPISAGAGGDGAASTGGGAAGQGAGGAAATSNGGSGQGGSGGVACGQDLAPTGGACPAICTGGCAGNTCAIDCDDNNECNREVIVCPDGFACIVRCDASNACKDAVIHCPASHACEVRCLDGCSALQIDCGAGTCTLHCGPLEVCENVGLACGTNDCSATCEGSVELPVVSCGESCDCTTCSP